jgi:hypothetical protein
MSWVVEPNAVGGWDVRSAGNATSDSRQSRHSSRDDAVAAARGLGGSVVVRGPRGDVLEQFGDPATVPASTRPGMRLAQLLVLSDQTDETGRLLLEDSAPRQAIKKAQRAGISMATVPAPYQDTPSRLGGQMNAAAYDVLRHDTADILAGFAWLADNHRQRAPHETGAPRRLYAVSYLGVNLVHVLFHRAVDPVPPHGQLPAYIASIFKASRGLFSFSVQLENDLGPSKAMTAAEVVQYAEDKRQLVRPDTGRVCAAPTRLIERTVEAILEGGDASKSALPDLIDFEALWEFYRQQDAVGDALSRFRVVAENMGAADPTRLFQTVIPGGPARGQTFGQFAEGTVNLVNEAQAAMNRALGRSENAKPIGLEELLRML